MIAETGRYHTTYILSDGRHHCSMPTIEVSDTVYDEILSRRRGRESIGKTLERELKPEAACETGVNVKEVDDMVRRTGREKTYTSEELRIKYGVGS